MSHDITKTIIVKRSTPEVYQLWANFSNFPQFMDHIKEVQITGPKTSHWVMEGPAGTTFEWDAVTTRLDEDQRIAWNSKDDSAITTSGQVTFKELPHNETEIALTMRYEPPRGKLGDAVAKLFAHPEARVEEDLRNFKHYVEARVSSV